MRAQKPSVRRSPISAGAITVVAVSLLLLTSLLGPVGCGGGSQTDAAPSPGADITAAPGATTSLAPTSEVVLRYSYEGDTTYSHDVSGEDQTTLDAALLGAGEGTVTSSEVYRERRSAVVRDLLPDGLATVALTYEKLASAVDGAEQDLSGETPRTSVVTMDTTGRVVAVEGYDEADATTGSFDASGFSAFFDYLDARYDPTVVLFPEDGLAEIGEEWTAAYTIPLPGMGKELTVTTQARLISVSAGDGRQVATIEHSSTMPLDVTLDLSAFFRAQLEGTAYVSDLTSVVVTMTLQGRIDYTATSVVDLATGQLVSAEGEAGMTIALTYSEAPEEIIPPGRRGPFTMTATGARTIVEAR